MGSVELPFGRVYSMFRAKQAYNTKKQPKY
jgi:hypothetical protein